MAQTSRSNPAIGGAVPTLSNQLSDGSSIWVLGLGDAIAHILRGFLKARQQREEKQRGEKEGTEAKAAA